MLMRTALLSILFLLFCAASGYAQAQLIAHWPLDGNTQEIINGKHGVPSASGVSWVTDDPQRGQVMQLDGVAGTVTLPEEIWTDPADTNTTITCWYNFAGGANWQRVFSLGKADPAWALMYYCPRDGDDNQLHITFHPAAPPDIWYDFVGRRGNMDFDTVQYYKWYFTAIIIDQYTLKVWLNDKLIVDEDSVYVTPQKFQPAGSINVLGQSHWAADATFNGMIDDFRIYDGPLTEAEVLALFYEGNTAVPEVRKGSQINLYGFDGGIMYSNVDERSVTDVAVYSITGSLLFRSHRISDLPGKKLQPGVYLVNVRENNELITKKVAVLK
jgi:hypothetical protein